MFRSVLLDKDLWIEHLKLDSVTGLDPPGIKIRAAQGKQKAQLYTIHHSNIIVLYAGLDAADYFITGLVAIY